MATLKVYWSRYGSRALGLGAILATGAVIASAVVFYHWLELTMVLTGVWFAAFVFAAPVHALLFWLISSPILDFYLKIPLGMGVPDLTFTRIMMILVTFVVLLQAVFKMRTILPLTGMEGAMLIFSCIAAGTMIIKDNFTQNLQIFVDGYATPFALFFISKNIINREKEVKSLTYAMAFTGLYLAGIGCIQYFTDINLFVPEGFIGIHEKRAYGPFVNAVEYGGVLVFFFLACFHIYTRPCGQMKKTLAFIVLGAVSLGVFFSMTRAVWLSFALALVIISAYYRKYRKMLSILMCAAVMVAIAALFILPDSSFFKERTFDMGAIYSRFAVYATAAKTIFSNPFFGYGFDRYSFYEASREHLTSTQFSSEAFGLGLTVPHNEFLHILVMLGILGLSSYLAIFYFSLKNSIGFYRRLGRDNAFEKSIAIFFWGALSVFIVNGMLVDLLFFSYFSSVFYIFMGMVEGVRLRIFEDGSISP